MGSALVSLHTVGSAIHEEAEALTSPLTVVATVVIPIAWATATALNFGRIVDGNTAATGKATLNHITSAVTYAGDAASGGGTPTRGVMTLTAARNVNVDVTASVLTSPAHSTAVGKSLTITGINVAGPAQTKSTSTPGTKIVVNITAGTKSSTAVAVGATATVPVNAPTGQYTGAINMIADYQ